MKFIHDFVLSKAEASFRIYRADGVSMRLDFFDHMLRVALVKDGTRLLPSWSVCPDGAMPLQGREKLSTDGFIKEEPAVTEEGDSIGFTLSGVRFRIEKRNFRITAENERGILYRDRDGLAYNFAGELGDGSVHFTRREETQRIFGLGDKGGAVNKNGRSFMLFAGDAMGFKAETMDPFYKHYPFYLCENAAGSYGLFYDTLSTGRIDFGQEHDNYFEPFNSIRFEEENMVFYLILGRPMEIIRRFNELCGGIAPVPDWAFRYCGSTMEYTDAEDADARLRGFIGRCEEYGIRPGGFYLSSGYTQIGEKRHVFHWNREKIPSPEGLADFFREHGAEIIPNVKPAFLTDNPLYGALARRGLFLHYADGKPALFPFWGGIASYLDFTNPVAYDFWMGCVRRQLVEKGYRSIWNDNNEYDVWDKDVYACGFGQEVPARQIRPLFAYLMSRASREASLFSGGYRKGEVPFIISRAAMPGMQRVATTWTGDNYTSFRELRFNHRQAMTMALSGFAFFGQDIGGFSGPRPEPELFLRWLQYGIFMPRFVLHSWKAGEPSTMPWLYPELMPAVQRLFALRERFLPYLAAQMRRAQERNEPLIYPVFLADPAADPEADCFFFGDGILACPVFDEGAQAVTVRLPERAFLAARSATASQPVSWRLRGEGEILKGGSSVTIPCAPEDLPVWFEAVPAAEDRP
ncbi:MAG: hypothetical protein IJL47_07640 [Lachnospiraceae bacterium]|nr:hypothetical protein [Lachnospiraceae bacterium]MBQ6196171.1 hypothetical protein [Lachnospiraceae bacterium]